MTKHIWAVVCKRSIVDAETNNVSLIDVLEEVSVSLPPATKINKVKKGYGIVPMNFEVVSMWIRESSEEKSVGRSRIAICDPSGRIVQSTEIDVDLREYQRMRTRQRFSGLPVRGEGNYWLCVELKDEGKDKWIEVDRVPLQVNIEKAKKG